jgi:opacity protein-like surface antigen
VFMKARKIILLAAALLIMFGTAAFANSITQNIRVLINKNEVDGGGLLVDNRAYVAVGEIAKSLQAMVVWNNIEKKASIYKPNVHMFTMVTDKDGDKAFTIIPKKGSKLSFRVHAQVDNMKTEISGLKFTIEDPLGVETLIEQRYEGDSDFPAGKTEYLLNTKNIEYTFNHKGTYIVRCWMQPYGESAMQVVAEKSIIVQ